jgi:hypothetical protein
MVMPQTPDFLPETDEPAKSKVRSGGLPPHPPTLPIFLLTTASSKEKGIIVKLDSPESAALLRLKTRKNCVEPRSPQGIWTPTFQVGEGGGRRWCGLVGDKRGL